MLLILLVVFVAVFGLFVLVTVAAGGRSTSRETVRATLNSVLLKTSRAGSEEIVDLRKNAAFSAIPWMDRLLARIRPAADLRRILDQADLAWTPGRVVLTGLAAWVLACYLIEFRTGNLAVSSLAALPAAAAPLLYVLKKRQRRFHRFEERLPDAIDLIVTALRAGNSTMGALGIVAYEAPEPIRRELRLCFDEQTYGVDMRVAMENLVNRVPLPDVRIITTAILIQKESGGNLAEVLDKTAQVIRSRFRLRDQIRVHSAQGRLTGWILSALPLVLGFVLFLMNPKYILLLFTHPVGNKLVTAGVIMNVLGLLVIRKIVNIKV
jgi:tight adherence protein B